MTGGAGRPKALSAHLPDRRSRPVPFGGISGESAETRRMPQSFARVTCKAYGKVNLGLSVLGRRQDGYHEVSTVMTAVNLFDLLTVELAPFKEGRVLSVCCPALPDLPEEQNLVFRAAREYLSRNPVRTGVRVRVDKGIPPGGGMGGGSSDAAATLLAVGNALRTAGALPPGEEACDLRDMARRLGADVPFFLGPNSVPPQYTAALCTGIGDIVTPMEANPFWLVILLLKEGVSTPWAFSVWDLDNPEGGRAFSSERDDRPLAVAGELRNGTAESLAQVLYNDLEEPIIARRKDIAGAKEALLRAGALTAVMTGSGSTVYGICGSQEHALDVRERIRGFKMGYLHDVLVVRTGVI